MPHATLAQPATTHNPSRSRGALVRRLVTVLLVTLLLVPAPGQQGAADARPRAHAARAGQEQARPKASHGDKKAGRKAKQARAKKNHQQARANKQQARQQQRKREARRQENQPANEIGRAHV